MTETTQTDPPAPQGPTSAPTPGANTDPPPRSGRGRPRGSRTKPPPLTEQAVGGETPPAPLESEPRTRRRRSKAIDKAALAKQLQGLHLMAAQITGMGFVQISEVESSMLADAIESVSREYDLELDGKTGAFIQLIAAAAVVYGPRLMHFRGIQKRAKEMGVTPQEVMKLDAQAQTAARGANGTPAEH